jgi:hypothetical protein
MLLAVAMVSVEGQQEAGAWEVFTSVMGQPVTSRASTVMTMQTGLLATRAKAETAVTGASLPDMIVTSQEGGDVARATNDASEAFEVGQMG